MEESQRGYPANRSAGDAFGDLVSTMARLRAPDGCPWDREQTHSSLAIHLLEETYEALDAIDRGDFPGLKEELGDLLLQVVFHAEIASEDGKFAVTDVVGGLLQKLIVRHPHVFGDTEVSSADEVVANWEALKHDHKDRSSPGQDLPQNLPALVLAYKALRRLKGAPAEMTTSLSRVRQLVDSFEETHDPDEVVGELLYEIVNVAQRSSIDPEGALRRYAKRRLSESSEPT